MAAQRKPAALHERTGSYRHDPKRRRKDVRGKGILPPHPPAWLQLTATQAALYSHIAALIPDGIASGSDVVLVGIAARALAKVQSSKFRAADTAQLRALMNSLGLSPAARAALGGPSGAADDNPFDEFGPGAQRAAQPN